MDSDDPDQEETSPVSDPGLDIVSKALAKTMIIELMADPDLKPEQRELLEEILARMNENDGSDVD